MHHRWRSARAAFFFGVVGLVAVVDRSLAAEVSFSESFTTAGSLEEAGSMSSSASPDWWVNSGGRLVRPGGTGGTIQGELPVGDIWRTLYASSNPLDTDDGLHPQNIFRLVTRRTWTEFQQTASFRIARMQMSASPNRNASNGLLFFNRYLDGNNLYYAGIRVDGLAVVKKKQGGIYTTLGTSKIYPGTWERTSSPNLLPIGRWIGLRSAIRTEPNGSVRVTLWVSDAALGGGWTAVLDVVDTSSPILAGGYAGIRTDFMDVELDDYDAAPLGSSATPTPVPTATRTPTAVPTATRTPSPAPTATPVAPSTPTPVPTATPVPPSTPTTAPTATRTPTVVPTPTRTATIAAPTPTRTPTRTPLPTRTPKKKGRSS